MDDGKKMFAAILKTIEDLHRAVKGYWPRDQLTNATGLLSNAHARGASYNDPVLWNNDYAISIVQACTAVAKALQNQPAGEHQNMLIEVRAIRDWAKEIAAKESKLLAPAKKSRIVPFINILDSALSPKKPTPQPRRIRASTSGGVAGDILFQRELDRDFPDEDEPQSGPHKSR